MIIDTRKGKKPTGMIPGEDSNTLPRLAKLQAKMPRVNMVGPLDETDEKIVFQNFHIGLFAKKEKIGDNGRRRAVTDIFRHWSYMRKSDKSISYKATLILNGKKYGPVDAVHDIKLKEGVYEAVIALDVKSKKLDGTPFKVKGKFKLGNLKVAHGSHVFVACKVCDDGTVELSQTDFKTFHTLYDLKFLKKEKAYEENYKQQWLLLNRKK